MPPNYRKVSKEFHLDYDKLEDRPSLPQQNGTAPAGNGNSRDEFQCRWLCISIINV